ncbi:uncharacterized protein LAESUDRAFT_677624 [Laetiporus sulphureus 93-53]|uniref:Uncharacterized protein n=1 Tax=Laetiporus sulphureus 93-53 TaxID=1314785 RepID=A0A165ETQ8_9APHY|nr:uncharacterized protein LAESUDRAFT_677624 [Laetiporus sulphureus 93-53]KZT07741.1 hypothetical protein LAESUDRAFT_677624 [Laetiporus sulphureus 93-53]
MSTFWNSLDWILPSLRVIDDLDDRLSDDGGSVVSTHPRSHYGGQHPHDLRREGTRQRDRKREQKRERVSETEHHHERDRRRIQGLERENATLQQRVTSLETDLRSARQTIATYTLLSSANLPSSSEEPVNRNDCAPDPANLRTAYDSLLSSYSLTRRALQERTEEVASLKSFLSKTDEWSGAQLIQALHDLNFEIVQLAASVAEEFASSFDRRHDFIRQSDRDLINTALGPAMTDLLATRNHASDPTLVQFAIQGWEIFCMGRVLNAFCFGLPAEIDHFLNNVFDQMHRAGPQPTASRWRALAYQHARVLLAPWPTDSGSMSPALRTLKETNLRGILAILALSGCTDSRGVRRDPLRSRFGDLLARISEHAEHIASVVKQRMMSSVFETTWVNAKGARPPTGASKDSETNCEMWFDWQTMDNVYAGYGSEHSKVLCTVEFGLIRVTRVDPADSEDAQAHMQESTEVNEHTDLIPNGKGAVINGQSIHSDDKLVRSILLKPRVVLESVGGILWHEAR